MFDNIFSEAFKGNFSWFILIVGIYQSIIMTITLILKIIDRVKTKRARRKK